MDQGLAALLGATVGVAGTLAASTISEWSARRNVQAQARQTSRQTYQKYADPLALSSTDLFWRLREIFDPKGSGFFLKGHVHLTKFEHYKVLSTRYRMANLLGWIRALRRELLFLPSANPKGAEDLDEALRRFELALAEGGHVEAR